MMTMAVAKRVMGVMKKMWRAVRIFNLLALVDPMLILTEFVNLKNMYLVELFKLLFLQLLLDYQNRLKNNHQTLTKELRDSQSLLNHA